MAAKAALVVVVVCVCACGEGSRCAATDMHVNPLVRALLLGELGCAVCSLKKKLRGS